MLRTWANPNGKSRWKEKQESQLKKEQSRKWQIKQKQEQ